MKDQELKRLRMLTLVMLIPTALLLMALFFTYQKLVRTQELLDWVIQTNQQHEYTVNGATPGDIEISEQK